MSDDRLAAELAKMRERTDQAAPGEWIAIADDHGRKGIEHSVWSEAAGAYVAEQIAGPDEACFIALARADIPRLLAAVEAILKPHQPGPIVVYGKLCKRHEAHRHFSITSTEASDLAACPDCKASVYVSCAGCHHSAAATPMDSCPVRSAITRALLGEDGADEAVAIAQQRDRQALAADI